MKTMELTEETAPRRAQSRILFVVRGSRPQSSAFMMRRPVQASSLRHAGSPVAAREYEESVQNGIEGSPGGAGRRFASPFIGHDPDWRRSEERRVGTES